MELQTMEMGEIKPVSFLPNVGEEIYYQTGLPEKVKMDCKSAVVKFGRNDTVVEIDKMLIVPVGFYSFEGKLYKSKDEKHASKKWGELFFVDSDDVVCSVLLHGQSLDNLMAAFKVAIKRNKLNIPEFSLDAKFVQKSSKEWGDYFAVSFEPVALDPEIAKKYKDFLSNLKQPLFNAFTVAEWAVKNRKESFEELNDKKIIAYAFEMGIFSK